MKNLSEKRTGERKELRQSVSFELSLVDSGVLRNVVAHGIGVDVSAGGMGLTTNYPLEGGEVVKVFFPVIDGETKLPVFTEVMWTAPTAGEIRAGLRFLT